MRLILAALALTLLPLLGWVGLWISTENRGALMTTGLVVGALALSAAFRTVRPERGKGRGETGPEVVGRPVRPKSPVFVAAGHREPIPVAPEGQP